MIFIEKSDLDDYRYAVGKVVFLRVYNNEYRLIKDIKNSNCMIVEDFKMNKIIISLFRKPTIGKKKREFTTLVYYQASTRINNKNQRILSVDFNNLYDKSIVLAILQPHDFIDRFSDNRSIIAELIENSFVAKDTSGTLFKYYTPQIIGNAYKILDGKISFMHPSKFNDPFDCTCLFANGNTVTNNIRVFCSIQNEKDILMWSYYGENHTGYCFEYSKSDIIYALSQIHNGICIMGKVDYTYKRPNYKLNSNNITFTSIKRIIECTFSKYKKWDHEDEYRFVLITNSTSDIAFQIQIPIINVFEGCRSSGKTLTNSNGKTLKTKKLTDDPFKYKLN